MKAESQQDTQYINLNQKLSPNPYRSNDSASKSNNQGYRKINFLETGYSYDNPVKNADQRVSVMSPYMNGKKNSLFLNPSLHTSTELKKTNEINSKKTPYGTQRAGTEHSTARKLHFEERAPQTIPEKLTPVEVIKPTQDKTPTHQAKSQPVKDTEMRLPEGSIGTMFKNNLQNVSSQERKRDIAPVEVNQRGDKTPTPKYDTKPKEAQKSETPKSETGTELINICDGCFNKELMDEHYNSAALQKMLELELERQALNHDNYLYQNQLTQEKKRKDDVKRTSEDNYNLMTAKKNDKYLRRGEWDLLSTEVKPHASQQSDNNIGYRSLLDNLHESSQKLNGERQGALTRNSAWNRDRIAENEREKSNERLRSLERAPGRSLLDHIYDNSTRILQRRSSEQKHAGEHNRSFSARRSMPYHRDDFIEDNFKTSPDVLFKTINSPGMLDRINDSNFDTANKNKLDLLNNSRYNREQSAKKRDLMKNPEEFDERFAQEYNYSPYKLNTDARSLTKRDGPSLLDNIHQAATRSEEFRHEGVRSAGHFNKSQIMQHNMDKANQSVLDLYYKTPSKKIGVQDDMNYDHWSNENHGILQNINKAAERLDQERKEREKVYENILKRQMEHKSQRIREEKAKEANFVETHKLICSHNSNLMYCNICNRRFPMNKITKILSNYKKNKKIAA